MLIHTVAKVMILAAEAEQAAGGEEGFFATIAKRYSQGGIGMYPITLCAAFLIAIIADRCYSLFMKANIDKEAFMRGLKKHIYAGDLEKAISYTAGQKQTPLTAVIKAGLMNVPKGEAEVQAAMDEATLRENPKLERRTGYLAMISNAAMLCGLLGTVNGLIACFEAVAHVNPADKATILSNGISEAMNCTAFGLLTAIPGLVAFSLLMGRTQHMIDDINEASVGTLNLIINNRDKFKMPANMPVDNQDA